ncbi:hypothetical protein ACFL0Q_08340, partial [Thermodesulfobacteriota bacterium]
SGSSMPKQDHATSFERYQAILCPTEYFLNVPLNNLQLSAYILLRSSKYSEGCPIMKMPTVSLLQCQSRYGTERACEFEEISEWYFPWCISSVFPGIR